ncbi:hypothetical protein Q5424_23105, partial [Conexibacter sp. JD483]
MAAAVVPAVSARADMLPVRPVLGAPASHVALIGAAPAAPGGGEIWAQGDVGAVPVALAGGGAVSGERVLLR